MSTRYVLRVLLALLDAGALILAAWLGWLIRFQALPSYFPNMVHVPQPLETMTGFLLLCAVAQLFFAANSQLYQFGHNVYRQQFFGSLRTVGLLFLVAIAYLVVFKLNFEFSRLATAITMLLLAILMPLFRLLFLRVVSHAGLLQVPSLLIAMPEALASFAPTLHSNRFARQTAVLKSLAPEELIDPKTLQLRPEMDQKIQDFIRNQKLDKIVILMDGVQRKMLVALLREFEIRLKYIKLVPDASSLALIGSRVINTDTALLLGLQQNLLHGSSRLTKRIIDSLLILPALPIFALLYIIFFPFSKGRPLRKIRRFNLDGQEFFLYQFKVNYERGGLFFQSGLYKIPEVLGILSGKQALVGPAPLIERELNDYGVLGSALRSIRPGMTGLWQVTDYGYFTHDHRMALDLYYAMNWSPLLDFRILLESAFKGLYCLFRPRRGEMRA